LAETALKSVIVSGISGNRTKSVALIETPVLDSTTGKVLRTKICGFRQPKIGKNSSLLAVHKLSAKKVKRIVHAMKMERKRQGIVEMVEEEEVEEEKGEEMEVVLNGVGTTIGGPKA
jgi:hypothetical protein